MKTINRREFLNDISMSAAGAFGSKLITSQSQTAGSKNIIRTSKRESINPA